MDCHHIAGAESYFTPVLSNADRQKHAAVLYETRYPLFSITWPYRGLKFTAHSLLVVNMIKS